MSREPVNNLLVLGSAGVGKTSTIKGFIGHELSAVEKTAGIEFSNTEIDHNNQTVMVRFWEFAGADFRYISQDYFSRKEHRHPKMALLLWDLSDKKTYDEMENHYMQLKDQLTFDGLDFKSFPILFIGCKIDLLKQCDVRGLHDSIDCLADKLQIKNYEIILTSSTENACYYHTTNAGPKPNAQEVMMSLLEKTKASVQSENFNEAHQAKADNNYKDSWFKHTRGARVQHLNTSIAGNKDSERLSRKDIVWLLLHRLSIKDAKSQTVALIKKHMGNIAYDYTLASLSAAIESKDQQSILDTLNSRFTASGYTGLPVSAFNSINKLLVSLDRKERKIFGYKICLFKSTRVRVHQEMDLILAATDRIYNYYVQKETKVVLQNDNYNVDDDRQALTYETLTDNLTDNAVVIPKEVENILRQFTQDDSESHQRKNDLGI